MIYTIVTKHYEDETLQLATDDFQAVARLFEAIAIDKDGKDYTISVSGWTNGEAVEYVYNCQTREAWAESAKKNNFDIETLLDSVGDKLTKAAVKAKLERDIKSTQQKLEELQKEYSKKFAS